MDNEFDFEAEFQKFEKNIKELNRMAEEIDFDCEALNEAQKEADKIEQLEERIKENPSDSDKLKHEIAERSAKIEKLLASIK